MNRKTFVILLLILLCLANLTRWAYRSRTSGERFSAESAAHFRYTRMVAAGEGVPRLDAQAQYPEGLKVFEETSVGMEYLYGAAGRLFPGGRARLDVFVRWFSVFIFTLAAVPLTLMSMDLWGKRTAGLATAFLFAAALPLVARSSGSELIRENLTLPLIMFSAWLLVRTARSGRLTDAACASAATFLALATWQGTQFYMAALVLLLAARAIAKPRRGEVVAGWAVVAAAAAAGALVPFLRAGGFLVSPSAALCAGLAGALAASRFSRSGGGTAGRLTAAAACFAAVLVPAVLAGRHLAAYSHFLGLIAYKIRYVYKPSDPSVLPFDVRAFWVGPFHSPDPLHFFVFALPLVLLCIGAIGPLSDRWKSGSFTAAVTGWLCGIFFILFLLMQRMLPFFAACAAVAAGGLPEAVGRIGSRAGRRAAASVAAALGVLMVLQVVFWEGRPDLWMRAGRLLDLPQRKKFLIYTIEKDPEGEMLGWISSNTARSDVVLSLHYLSPQILTYTGRPTNLNDFFEAPRLRAKAGEMLRCLYSGEKSLLSFCRKNGSDWLVLSTAVGCDPYGDSPLYQAGLDHMPPGCAAYLMMFEPSRLDSFDLVFENEMYRIFRIGDPPSGRRMPASPLCYRSDLLWYCGGDISTFLDTVNRIYAATVRASRLAGGGGSAEAEKMLGEVLRTEYFHPAWRILDKLLAGRRAYRDRLALAEFAWENDPYRPEVCLALAECRIAAGDKEGAYRTLEACGRLPMSGPESERFERLSEMAADMSGLHR